MYEPMVVRESAPTTTPPSNCTAIMVVCVNQRYAQVDFALFQLRLLVLHLCVGQGSGARTDIITTISPMAPNDIALNEYAIFYRVSSQTAP